MNLLNGSMKYLLLLVFTLSSIFVWSQDSINRNINESIISQIPMPCEIYQGEVISSKVNLTYKNGKKIYYLLEFVQDSLIKPPVNLDMVSNRAALQKLNVQTRTNNEILIIDSINNLDINIYVKKDMDSSLNLVNTVTEFIFDDTLIYVLTKDSLWPRGFNSNTLFNYYISEILISFDNNAIKTPIVAYSDLFSPNFTDSLLYISPLEAYYSAYNNCIYIYLFGYFFDQDKQVNSYLTKIIYNLETGYVGRILAPQSVFDDFNCKCSKFIGF